jgi:hypothetical protein
MERSTLVMFTGTYCSSQAGGKEIQLLQLTYFTDLSFHVSYTVSRPDSLALSPLFITDKQGRNSL